MVLILLLTIVSYLLLSSRRHFLDSGDYDYFLYGENELGRKAEPDHYEDHFESMLIKDLKVHNTVRGQVCLEKRNFVFIKTMKCATQTLVSILRRFGYRRHLNFVLPRVDNIYIGWPYIPEPQDYRPSKREFNALVDHSVYNETVMKALMPATTHYITIIREPFSLFKSAFNYFNIANITKMNPSPDQLSDYLKNLQSFEGFYKSREAAKLRYCIPDGFSVTKNLLSHCLGMPLGFPSGRENIESDNRKIQEYIERLDKTFALVMIMEYFHESLILLRRIMCWSIEDIIYHTVNVGKYAFKTSKPSSYDVETFRKWSHIDYLLYDHFNKTFWKKVSKQGPDFFEEVKVFNEIQSKVSAFCSDLEDSANFLRIPATRYHDNMEISKDNCLMLDFDLLKFLKIRFEREEGWVDSFKEPKRGC